MINLNDANFLEKFARFVPYILTLLGFVIAIFNQRIVDLRKDERIEEKYTPVNGCITREISANWENLVAHKCKQ